MGSRLRDNVQHLFECFCEIAAPLGEKPPWILQKYPTSFLDEEILKSVPKFAYPCEIENVMVQHFSFVLTSIDSKWTFGFCRHDPKTDTALVILSALPWHEIFYKFLNNIATLMSNGTGEELWKFLETVYKSPVPIPGSSISIPVPNSKVNFVCQSPKQFQLPSIPENRNLTEYYSAVDAHNMMIIFASMLYERRIIFTSKRLSRLSACVQACNALIYPMIWQHIYIPVLPLSLIDYLLAPMPFLIGVPTPTLQRVHKSDLGEVVILDADVNIIDSPFQDLESLPQDVVTNLKKALRNRSALLGDGVSRAFLRALVQLTAGYRDALTLEQGQSITFNQNAFVESRPSSMQPFLRKMLELQIFQQFIEERLNMLNSGLGFSDEFEMEACSYSAKSGSKFMQQYREWTYTMRKESSAFFRSVKDKVKDKGKDMKTVYKGLKWKGRSNRSDTSLRFHQPRSAPSSPTSDRRPIDFSSPPKSPNGFTATTSYRKDLRIRNSNFTDSSRKQYSPLSPSSPEESDFPPERVNIDLMQELRHVIFPNTPPVDRTLKPVRSLDSLRPAWSGHIRHGPPPSTIITNPTVSSIKTTSCSSYSTVVITSVDQSNSLLNINDISNSQINENNKMFSFNTLVSKPNKSKEESEESSLLSVSQKCIDNIQSNNFSSEILKTEFTKYDASLYSRKINMNQCKNNFERSTKNSTFYTDNIFPNYNSDFYLKENDPFDTSKVFMPSYLQPVFQTTNASLSVNCHVPSHAYNNTSCSTYSKVSPEVPDLIRLDSTTSTEDFDPLLSKSSEFTNSKQMTQSLHIPEMGEGLSNPLYPYFQPLHKNNDEQQKSSDNAGDMDLLQAYGLDFNKFSISNGDSPSKNSTVCNTSESSINIDSTFSLTLNTPAIKSQNNWTKFE
ncbi:DENN domain-containing protein 1A isoform X2 [Apis mellifera]|uniref:DENN domain-containing protein 1A isoform X2 n=1 Tax=Apis mellifera TaxID=7460 RepID=A0A7M7H1P2_APIME|nr:DENN domain-containing protein 1A isoform X2 [Apis mellifera]|eukprot:XP_006566784.1 DENN domain-containing protein 1A isoform X2 [Apis mellifera]